MKSEGILDHIIMFSGGVSSWATAQRVKALHGVENMVLLFADTKMEDKDLYRFLHKAASNIGAPLVVLQDGRTPWEVFRDKRFLGNTRTDPCSKILKRDLCWRWVRENYKRESSIIYLGYGWDEVHRLEGTRKKRHGWKIEAPLTEPPYISKTEMLKALAAEGIRPPRLYSMGFPHNNCGGFCVKAGQAQFALLLRTMPKRYAFHEEQEEKLRAMLGKNVSILRDRRGGKTKPLTMRQFRERLQCTPDNYDVFEWGGCGCGG